MRSINTKSRVPFVVSLTLIFGYGLLQLAVPPTVIGTQDLDPAMVTAPEAQPPVELVTQAGHAQTPADDTRPSIQ